MCAQKKKKRKKIKKNVRESVKENIEFCFFSFLCVAGESVLRIKWLLKKRVEFIVQFFVRCWQGSIRE